jgi:hypothetical protein
VLLGIAARLVRVPLLLLSLPLRLSLPLLLVNFGPNLLLDLSPELAIGLTTGDRLVRLGRCVRRGGFGLGRRRVPVVASAGALGSGAEAAGASAAMASISARA